MQPNKLRKTLTSLNFPVSLMLCSALLFSLLHILYSAITHSYAIPVLIYLEPNWLWLPM